MSLINDALKRASQTDRSNPRPAETYRAMEPASHRRSSVLVIAVGAVVVLSLALAAWCFSQWWSASHPSNGVKAAPMAVVAPKPVPPRAPAPSPTPAPTPVVRQAPVPTPTLAPVPPVVAATPVPKPAPAAVAAPSAAQPVTPELPWPVELKLTAIFYSKANPKAFINGKTYRVGEDIEGITVKDIEVSKVTVEWKGQVKELVME